jgi:hypothetical protein
MPYACSWYLNLVAPGWCALVEDEYARVMPVPVRSKYGFPYVPQPYYTQQLGIFGNENADELVVSRFISALPARFKLADLALNAGNPMPADGFKASLKMNMEVNLRNTYEVTSMSYSENTRRNISKARKAGLMVQNTSDPAFLLETKWNNRPAALRHEQWKLSARIIQVALSLNAGEIWEVTDTNGEKLAAVFFLTNDIRKIYLISASTSVGKELGAMFLLVDKMIEINSGKEAVLDFEGSVIPGIARFFMGFGAEEKPFPYICIRRLPRLLNRIIH